MKRVFGILIIIFSLFIALGGLLTMKEDFKASIFGIFGISMPIYLVGHIVRTNMWQAKQKVFSMDMGVYLCCLHRSCPLSFL